jgi:hypothetical protein
MNSFEELIVGHYRNQRQAMSNPAKWPQIDIRIISVGYGLLESKSWYKYKGEKNSYKHFQHHWEYITDDVVTFTTKNLLYEADSCPYIWKWDGEWWRGTTEGECIHKDTRVISRARFNGDEYRSLDTGYDIDTNTFKWGKEPTDGEFEFVRIG